MPPPDPTAELRFRWPWRPYQARVLDVIDRHLADDRLHIVAAPGAGKTTLGLEVFRRLGRPGLVLAPTLTIRNQWIRRLRDFMPERPPTEPWRAPPWVSSELSEPAFLTVATYQAMLSAARRDEVRDAEDEASKVAELAADDDEAAPTREDESELAALLAGAGVGTLILDEAHHLTRAWWRSLGRVIEEIDGLRLVSLTGTPPYDASGHEWRRYEELCGPIDEEISVPELVKAGTLCPHQDFVYAVAPLEDEARAVREHATAVDEVLSELIDDPRLQALVDSHPWMGADPPIEAVLDAPEVAVALLAYQRATGAGVSIAVLHALDLVPEELPTLDRDLWGILLKDVLHGMGGTIDTELAADLANNLRSRGLLFRRQLRVASSPLAERALSASGAKVQACVTIHDAERDVRGDALRQVILTDYIRDGSLDSPPGAAPMDLGAFPVFDALKRDDVLLLTGRLTCLHESRLDALARALGAPVDSRALPHRPDWHAVQGVPSGRLVAACTALLGAGTVRVVVGTRALLGEGWDAPAVNSIVLASYVGAFVSTNQMRGRAIRANAASGAKVASVWHLVAVMDGAPTGLLDVGRLAERFTTFVGLSHDGSLIESGIDRLGLPPLQGRADLEAFNAESRARLQELPSIAAAWERAIEVASVGRVVPSVSFRRPPTLRPFQLTRTLRYVLLEAGWATLFTLGGMIRGAGGQSGPVLMIGAAIPMLLLAPKLLRAGRLAFLHAPVDGSVRQIGQAVFEALRDAGHFEGEPTGIVVSREEGGRVHVSLDGGSFRDQSTFVDAVGEVLGPVDNPRYLVTRPTNGLFGRRIDHHAVPTVLAARREGADAFHAAWLRHVGAGDLCYTRREGGRALLLAARGRSFANQFVDPARRVDRWR